MKSCLTGSHGAGEGKRQARDALLHSALPSPDGINVAQGIPHTSSSVRNKQLISQLGEPTITNWEEENKERRKGVSQGRLQSL